MVAVPKSAGEKRRVRMGAAAIVSACAAAVPEASLTTSPAKPAESRRRCFAGLSEAARVSDMARPGAVRTAPVRRRGDGRPHTTGAAAAPA